jgi:hypothetical protein
LTQQRRLDGEQIAKAMEKDLSRDRAPREGKSKRQERHLRQNDLAESH